MSQSIGSFARQQILLSPTASNQEILDQVKLEFPQAKTSIACIAWYKSDMKKKGVKASSLPPAPRTLELIDEEIMAAELRVLELQEEREAFVEAQRAEFEAEFARLAALLGKNVKPEDIAPASEQIESNI